jgi:murein DD-endopeptidase MepM/ murein hydrolase activator NlpD
MRKARHHSQPIAAMIVCFVAGAVSGWWVGVSGAPEPRPPTAVAGSDHRLENGPVEAVEHDGGTDGTGAAMDERDAIDVLHEHNLRLPIDGVSAESFKGGFREKRAGDEDHSHEAVDILAPRHTPIHAIEDGTIAKLFFSKAGGNTIYQYDPSKRFCYYYAHLDRYADGLHDGDRVDAGAVIGYVGTSGNAPLGTPHLHFAIFELEQPDRWWKGRALDPYLVFRK